MRRRSALLILQLLTISFMCAIYLVGIAFSLYENEYFEKVAFIAVLGQLLYMLLAWRQIQPGPLNLFVLFTLMVLLTHGSVPILRLFGIEFPSTPATEAMIRAMNKQDIWQGSFVIAIFLGAFTAGAISVKRRAISRGIFMRLDQRLSKKAVELHAIGLLVIGIIAFSIYATNVGALAGVENYQAYFYGAESAGTVAYNLMYFLVVGSLGLLIYAKRNSPAYLLAILALLTWVAFFFVLGSRNRAIFVALALMIALRERGLLVPTPLVFGIIFAVVGLSLPYTQYRLTGNFHLFTPNASLVTVAGASIEQLGVYFYIVAATVKQFTEVWLPNWGLSYLNSVSFILPFGQRVYLDRETVTWLAQLYYQNTLAVNPRFGTGFSFIAEAFESFSWAGALIMFIIGRFVGTLSLASSRSRIALFFVLSTLPYLLFYVRDVSWSLARGIIWFGVLPLLFAYVLNSLPRRRRDPYA